MNGIFLILLGVPVFAGTTLINGTAASVGKTLITVQDAYVYRSLQRLREGKQPAIVIETGDALKQTVQRLAFEEMVFQEMRSIEYLESDKNHDDRRAVAIREKHKDNWQEIQKRFTVTDKKLLSVLAKSLQVESFLQKKVETLTPMITDAETETYYNQHRERFKNDELSKIKPNIVALLRRQSAQKGLEDWARSLKEKYGVVNRLP